MVLFDFGCCGCCCYVVCDEIVLVVWLSVFVRGVGVMRILLGDRLV